MSLQHRKGKLEQRMRRERMRLNAKYRALIRRVEEECEQHEFGDWYKQHDARTGFYVSNFLGEPFVYKKCVHCGKIESKIRRNEKNI